MGRLPLRRRGRAPIRAAWRATRIVVGAPPCRGRRRARGRRRGAAQLRHLPVAANPGAAGIGARLTRSSTGRASGTVGPVDDFRGACDGPTRTRLRLSRPAGLGERGHQPHPVHGLHRRGRQHRRELERFFYRGHWCYVGLEAEIPNRATSSAPSIGERSVIMVRDADGGINVVENVCAHRGMQLLPRAPRQPQGLRLPVPPVELHAARATCRACRSAAACKQDGKVNGGMPADFKTADHGLNKLKVASARRRGLRLLRPRRRVARGLPRPGGAALLRPPVQRPQADASSATTGSASRATGS